MEVFALAVVVAAGMWLVAVAFLMALRPAYCLGIIGKMTARLQAADWRLQATEQGLRVLAGAALVVRAPTAKLPLVFEVVGWVLVVSSLLILWAPMRWHAWYGAMLSERLTPAIIRVFSPVPAVAGVGLIYAAI